MAVNTLLYIYKASCDAAAGLSRDHLKYKNQPKQKKHHCDNKQPKK